ncbi:MAG: hypothetical protein AABX65_00875 [Nanoarchaeota archaeon]
MAKEELPTLKLVLLILVCLSILVLSALSIALSILFSNFLTAGFSAFVAILLISFSAILSYFSLSSFFEDEKSLLIATILISVIASIFAIGAYIGNEMFTSSIERGISDAYARVQENIAYKNNLNLSANIEPYAPIMFRETSPISLFLLIPIILIIYNFLPILFLMLKKK